MTVIFYRRNGDLDTIGQVNKLIENLPHYIELYDSDGKLISREPRVTVAKMEVISA